MINAAELAMMVFVSFAGAVLVFISAAALGWPATFVLVGLNGMLLVWRTFRKRR